MGHEQNSSQQWQDAPFDGRDDMGDMRGPGAIGYPARWCRSNHAHTPHVWQDGLYKQEWECGGVSKVGAIMGEIYAPTIAYHQARDEAEGLAVSAGSHDTPVSNSENMTTARGRERAAGSYYRHLPTNNEVPLCAACGTVYPCDEARRIEAELLEEAVVGLTLLRAILRPGTHDGHDHYLKLEGDLLSVEVNGLNLTAKQYALVKRITDA